MTAKKAATPAKPDDYVSYGYSAALAAAVPEIKTLLAKAAAGKWDVQRFQDALQTTSWWKANSDTAKQMVTLQKQDPAQYNQQYTQAQAHVKQIAASMGVTLSAAQIANQATVDLWQGQDDATVQSQLGALYTGPAAAGSGTGGTAVSLTSQIQQLAQSYGVPVTGTWVNGMVKTALTNGTGVEGAQAALTGMAQTTYPSLAQQLAAGQTTEQIAQPYIAAMSNTLELPDSGITLNDPTIQKALQQVQLQPAKPAGASAPAPGAGASAAAQPPALMPMWQFNQQLKADPRWQQTDNAKGQAYSMLHSLGQSFGFAS